jgi:hypothetical protein
MWNMLAIAVMSVLVGLVTMSNANNSARMEDAKAARLADSFWLYRQAVRAHFAGTTAGPGSVETSVLVAENRFPAWSNAPADPSTSTWANYMDAGGRIYLYARSVPPTSVITHLLRQSHNSVFLGTYRTGHTTLFSPLYGDTGIPLPVTEISIPAGSPVWIVMPG